MNTRIIGSVVALSFFSACHVSSAQSAEPRATSSPAGPAPLAPLPSARQTAAAELESYAFVHFNMNTFTGNEWGSGKEDESTFAPTALDCRQWARVARDAGLRGILLTAKHHDGFCLWPSKYTQHSVARSKWRDGKGDVVRELRQACDEFGLKLGLYLSPWDRNSPLYGDSEKYNDFYAAQLTELCSQYGELFEIWWDGACGEGPNGKKQIYDFERFTRIVRELQPQAVIFSDIGPDVRWCGNESGFAGETDWAMISPRGFRRGEGAPPTEVLNAGLRDGSDWMRAECDVSIRPGWFYHADEDQRVKSVDELEAIYEASVGRNASMLLNFPVDRRGLIHENDAARSRAFRERIDATYRHDGALGATRVRASSTRADAAAFGPARAVDGSRSSYWTPKETDTAPWIEVELDAPRAVNRVLLCEALELGQRVARCRVTLDAGDGSAPRTIDATTIGRSRILAFATAMVRRMRLELLDSRAVPTISTIGLFRAPPKLRFASELRQVCGDTAIRLECDESDLELHYTLDGSEPTKDSARYSDAIHLDHAATVRAGAFADGLDAPVELRAEFTSLEARELQPAILFFRKPDAGLACDALVAEGRSVEDFHAAQPTESSVVEHIDLSRAPRAEHFALVFHGFVSVPKDGLYAFRLVSDDGSRLRIGSKVVVDHDGLHGASALSGTIALASGWHEFRLEYFNASGDRALELQWAGASFGWRDLSPEQLAH